MGRKLTSATNSVSLVFVDLCTKKKLFIKCDDVKFLACPQYEGLAVHDILEEAGKDERVLKYLPDERDMHKVPRQWIVNIAYAIIGAPFANWVSKAVSNRNMELAKKQDLILNLDPEIVKAFHNSSNISTVSNLSPHNLNAVMI